MQNADDNMYMAPTVLNFGTDGAKLGTEVLNFGTAGAKLSKGRHRMRTSLVLNVPHLQV